MPFFPSRTTTKRTGDGFKRKKGCFKFLRREFDLSPLSGAFVNRKSFRNTAAQIVAQRFIGRTERDLRFRLDRASPVFQDIAAVAFRADARRIAFRAVRRTGDLFDALTV